MIDLIKIFKAAVHNEFPKVMRSMSFQGGLVRIPYTTTDYYPPEVVHRDYEAEKYVQYEARKVNTETGPLYGVYRIETVIPGVKEKQDVTEKKLGRALYTKEKVLSLLQKFDETEEAKGLYKGEYIDKDAAHTRHYFGKYLTSKV